jgi:hypothetical protein
LILDGGEQTYPIIAIVGSSLGVPILLMGRSLAINPDVR